MANQYILQNNQLKMETNKIFDENGKGFYRAFSTEKVELVNPAEFFKNYELEKRAIVMRDMLHAKDPFMTSLLDKEFFIKQAAKTLEGFFETFEQIKINENLEKVLTTTKKKDQIRLLKGVSINPDELAALIFKSFSAYGYLFSRYIFETLPNGTENKKLPKMFRLKKDGTIEKSGATNLTDSELKNIILNRKVIVSNFFEKKDAWHCFFIT
jgi:hypothetical protein